MYALGIDAGASSVKLAALEGGRVVFTAHEAHSGAVRASLARLLDALDAKLGLRQCGAWMATGSAVEVLQAAVSAGASTNADAHARGFRVPVLEDVPALVEGARVLAPQAGSIVSIGGESAYFVTDLAQGGVPRFSRNDSCAAGTGSFFEDQMGRLGLSIEGYSSLVSGAQSVPRLSGRCAVFAKTDIIHLQQEGTPVRDILLGLCYALARSYKATIVRSLPVTPPVVLAGGVVRNAGMARAAHDVFGLDEDQLVTGERFAYLQAVGAAHAAEASGLVASSQDANSSHPVILSAREGSPQAHAAVTRGLGDPSPSDWDHGATSVAPSSALAALRSAIGRDLAAEDDLVRLDPLPALDYRPGEGYRLRPQPWPVAEGGKVPCYLGIDVGSTSTNLVLVDAEGQLIDAQYLRTRGDAEAAVRQGLASLESRLGGRVRVLACATTGSGRGRIGQLVGADVVRDEITAQARAAAAADAQVDTVFEIGGQDSKYIRLEDGRVAGFQMNRICAAGTGSFVEEQAARLGIPLSEYGALALSSKAPVDLGERCTVFVESAMSAALAKGAPLADVAAGLACSVVRNYLHKVVGGNPVGSRVVLQGGVAYNPAIVAAFRAAFPGRVIVSPWFAVSGAVGAALLAAEEHRAGKVARTAFRGFQLEGKAGASQQACSEEVQRNLDFFEKTRAQLTAGYTGRIDPARKTVGIPRALLMYKFFALANAFFAELGYNVLFTDDTDAQVVALSQECAQGEVCYPVKLLYGHMRKLADAGVDYVFFPAVHTIRHAKSHVPHNFACPYMQVAPQIAARGLGLQERGIGLLCPTLDLDMGQEGMAGAMMDVGARLGHDPRATARALMAGAFAVQQLDRATEALGDELLSQVKPGERVIVLVARQYGVYDEVLNMGIPQELIRRGCKVAVLSNLRAHNMNVGPDHPGLCWPFGQHLVSGAKMIRRDPRLFMVYLTNHGCGPDTMMAHVMAEEMAGKPYLHVEVDEHFSKVGVVTRIEAFLNSLDSWNPAEDVLPPLYTKRYQGVNAPATRDGRVLCLPDFGPHCRALGESLQRRGFSVRMMRPSADAVARGHDMGFTKEYLSFSALAGMSLLAAQQAVQAGERVRLLLPSSIGAEPDAVYDRVIRGMLDDGGFPEVAMSAFQLERLPWNVEDAPALFDALLEGDARQARAFAGDGLSAEAPVVQAVGEWSVACSELSSGAWDALRSHGVRVRPMPLAEYLLFLWYDCAEDDRHARSTAPMPLDGPEVQPAFGFDLSGLVHASCGSCQEDCEGAAAGGAVAAAVDSVSGASARIASVPAGEDLEEVYRQRMAVLDGFACQLAETSARLGDESPYDDMAQLHAWADGLMGRYRGANGRYRAAKAHVAAARTGARKVSGIVHVSSLYENTQTALDLLGDAPDVPTVTVGLDGALGTTLEQRLASFAYYL